MTLRLLRAELAQDAYAKEIDAALPRVLALTDCDPLSPTVGYGDRQYWAWKLIDFPNGTLQGGVNGLSALLKADVLAPHVSRATMQARLEQMLEATPRIMRRDGSFEEALPFEQSYCVTALVAYDHLTALMRCSTAPAGPARMLERAIEFLIRRDETHGFISNHLATASAALLRWDRLTGDAAARRKALLLLDRIVSGQSSEGWFVEYGGADPGYQTLCMAHLADAAELLDDARLWKALELGIGFVRLFEHPDGSFGGVYGSRATRLYYPAAMEMLKFRFPEAAALAASMKNSVATAATVPLAAIDQPNLLPLFNNYCQALVRGALASPPPGHRPPQHERRWMPEAGLLVDIGPTHQTVVSTRKGGVVYHWRDGALVLIDCGIVFRDGSSTITTQSSDSIVSGTPGTTLTIHGTLRRRALPLPDPFNFLILRILAMTLMRLPPLGAVVKRLIARLLIHAGGKSMGSFTREIRLGHDLRIADQWQPSHLIPYRVPEPFSVIHMASAGYWQAGDTDEPKVGI